MKREGGPLASSFPQIARRRRHIALAPGADPFRFVESKPGLD
jgi:hypothetical protein